MFRKQASSKQVAHLAPTLFVAAFIACGHFACAQGVPPAVPAVPGANYGPVSANAVAGPMGYVETPSLTNAVQSQTALQQAIDANQNYNFPSIIVYISAVPVVNPPSGPKDVKRVEKQETDLNPIWLDASFTLTFYKQDGSPLPNACKDGSVQVLGLLPQQTVTALKNQTISNVSSTANDVAGALSSFYPASGVVAAATKALNVLFQDIFPPQPVAYEYSNLIDQCNFGWYFRQNKSSTSSSSSTSSASGDASILGIQTGIILLKTNKEIGSIKVNGRSLSQWSKPVTSDDNNSDVHFVSDNLVGTITLPSSSNINYDNLADLSMFPALIAKKDAENILHFTSATADQDFIKFATANKLVGTDSNFDWVTNASLSAFLKPTTNGQSTTDGQSQTAANRVPSTGGANH